MGKKELFQSAIKLLRSKFRNAFPLAWACRQATRLSPGCCLPGKLL